MRLSKNEPSEPCHWISGRFARQKMPERVNPQPKSCDGKIVKYTKESIEFNQNVIPRWKELECTLP